MNIEESFTEMDGREWQRKLANLLAWLEQQKGGVATFYEFQRQSLALRDINEKNAALLRLLADLAGRFADRFDGEPLDISTANKALAVLTGYVRDAGSVRHDQAADLLKLLNRIARDELGPIG